ncbi:MAG TPA: VIT1/CCC1 family protein [Stellaceae bacterium]|jgi:vacuolar iron transporter family protein|nr:VIT1/CCC1 family protein [Stellaceae bacterium]
MPDQDKAERYRSNLQGELDSAALYRTLAESEATPQMREVYRRLAAIEEKHAALWREQLAKVGESAGHYRASFRTRVLAWLAGRFGAALVLPMVAAIEHGDRGMYDDQPEAQADGLPSIERSHSRVLQAASRPIGGGLSGGALAQLEGRHRTGGNALRAAVLGANDGLVSNLSLVMGVAGAEFSSTTVLVTGLAGLLAGACSMAMGEWLSVTSARELYGQQIATEKAELEDIPEEEQEELELIYQAKGLSADKAKELAARIIASPAIALDTLVREELGIDPDDLGGSPWTAAGTSFLLFAIGAIFPVAPFFFLSGAAVIATSLFVSACAMFAIGAGTSLFTGRGVLFSGARQIAIGLAAAGVTFGLGRLIGVSIGG